MNKPTSFRIFICIFIFSFFLYLYTDQQNSLTRLRIRLPAVAKEIKAIREENKRLHYEVDQFESPHHLIELSRRSEFSHLKQPFVKEILNCQEGVALEFSSHEKKPLAHGQPKPTLATVK